MKALKIAVICFCLLGVSSCSNTRVTRLNESEASDLSGNWNETDSKLVSEYMIEKLLEDSWQRLFRHRYQRKPVISISRVLNKTTEHISTNTFIKDIELALLKSNDVELVVSGKDKEAVRNEREDYQDHNEHPGGTRIYQEKEVDFILSGTIFSVEDQLADTKTVFYQVDLELVSVATNEKTWIAQKRIKKVIEKPLLKW